MINCGMEPADIRPGMILLALGQANIAAGEIGLVVGELPHADAYELLAGRKTTWFLVLVRSQLVRWSFDRHSSIIEVRTSEPPT